MAKQNWGDVRWIVVCLAIASLGTVIALLRMQATPPSTSTALPRSEPAFTAQTPEALANQWVVSAAEAKSRVDAGATLLDARGDDWKGRGSLVGSIAVTWQQFSQPHSPQKGNLLTDDATLTKALRAIGISSDRPVVVVADPKHGWGEDGRIVWMLRTLGHTQAVLVDGGYAALIAAGISQTRDRVTVASTPGNFVVNRIATWDIQQNDLRAALNQENVVIIDTREPREFQGQTPYGEMRGGHIPGAVSLYFKDFLDEKGYLLPNAQIRAQLAKKGISRNTEIVSYCTGGIRSAWVTAVLIDLGFTAKNYAGSTWEWSASPANQFPLVKQ
jgi:thiosulfate/3-mercaptopyruvate sulfurtransferase